MKIVYVPGSIVYHKVSLSIGGEKNKIPEIDYYAMRNSFLMIKNTQSKVKIASAFLFSFYRIIKKHIKLVSWGLGRKSQRSRLIFKGFVDGLKGRLGKLEE